MSFTLEEIGCKLEPLPNELWKAVSGTTGYYVSNMGRLLCRNWKNHGVDAFMKPAATQGYMRTMLKYGNKLKTIKVHRIVAQAWIPNPDNLATVDHLNFDPADNRAENLIWATHGGNARRSAAAGRFASVKGSKNPFSKLNEETVKEIRAKFYGGMTRKQLGEEYGVAASTIKDAILRRWKHVA